MSSKKLRLSKLGDMPKNLFQNKSVIAMTAMLVFGLIIGSAFVRTSGEDPQGAINIMASGFITGRDGATFLSVFSKSFFSVFVFIFIAFLLGNFNFGCFVVPFLPMIRGLGLGMSMGFIYCAYGAKGFLYTLVIIIPPALISSMALIFASKDSFRFSFQLFRKLGKRAKLERINPIFQTYCKKFLIYILILAVASLTDSILNSIFANLFNFM